MDHPTAKALRRLNAFRGINATQLSSIANLVTISAARKGTQLLHRGHVAADTIFLLEGELRLIAADGSIRSIKHTDPAANDPVARLRPVQYDVLATTAVKFLLVTNDLLDAVSQPSALDYPQGYLVEEEEATEECDARIPELIAGIEADLALDRLLLPSLPDVAIKIGQAIDRDDIEADRIATLVQTDPAIATKLLKAANSARYTGVTKAKTVQDAVVRLGLRTTHRLVVAFVLREVFRTECPSLRARLRALWQHSALVGALSQNLANGLKGFQPDLAMLAGLVHDIGDVAVINYLITLDGGMLTTAEFDAVLAQTRGPVGQKLLAAWDLTPELAEVAAQAEAWDQAPQSRSGYVDLVQLAQMHAFVVSHAAEAAPADIAQTPAYRRLQPGPISEQGSLELLEAAAEQVAQTVQLVSA